MKKTFILLLLVFGTAYSYAQEQDTSLLDISAGSDLMSRYVWRGTQFSTGPSIQPCAEISFKGLTFGAWGAYSFDGNDGAEADLYLSYTFLKDMLSLTITDYFFPDEISGAYDYFDYNEETTGHIYEASLSFNGTDNLPLSFLAAVNIYGADAKKINKDPNSDTFNEITGNQYSTYMELNYSLKIQECSLDIFAGFTPNKPNKADNESGYIGESGFYGKTTGFVNIGFTFAKEIEITNNFVLPIQTSLITNPMDEKIFIVFGLSL